MENIVIIGAGIAALSAAESARKIDEKDSITIITEEEYYPYYRIKLSKFVGKELNKDDIFMHSREWYKEKNIKIITSSKVEMINPDTNKVMLKDNKEIDYTKLIIASGSSSFIPPINGADLNGVFSIRKLNDVININDYIKNNHVQNITIIGGGLLGIEAAWSLIEGSSIKVNIIENNSRLLPRQMDKEGSIILEKFLEQKEIILYKNSVVKEISGEHKVDEVLLENGTNIKSDMVIISAGVRSNIGMPKGCGINTNKGILVDSFMNTNINNISAAGDVAEYNGMVYGIWPVAMEQGKIAGLNSLGYRQEYKEIIPSNLMQVMGVNIFSTGNINDVNSESIRFNHGIYTKLFFEKGILCGAILIGDTKKGFALKKLIEEKKNFSKEINEGTDIISNM